jgi:hypothetical protein
MNTVMALLLCNNPKFNNSTGMYEVYMKAKNSAESNNPNIEGDYGVYKFTSPSLYETNTTFDPEIESAEIQEKTVNQISFFGYNKTFDKRIKPKLAQPPWPVIEFGFPWPFKR